MANYTNYVRRLEHHWSSFESIYQKVYPATWESTLPRFKKMLNDYNRDRGLKLKHRDNNAQYWYLDQKVIAMTLYIDLFSTNITILHSKIPYFKELGITLIHFMPLLKPRDGENDGGYAVADYKSINPQLGTMDELESLVAALAEEGIYTCVDFVINHSAKEHQWAKEAMELNEEAMSMYYMYDTDEIPKKFEATVPQVFPGVSPGNFTYYESINRWVFTSFYEFQWDLNFHNPLVFHRLVDIFLYLANKGIQMIRLDAIPFIWKELHTNCRNLPMIHNILKLFQLVTQIVCPSVVILGEAIVEPSEIVKYFGDDLAECQLMYNATQMVNIWNSLATRDTRLLYEDHDRLPVPKWGCWINYARCHDDIGWGFNESAIANMGLNPSEHKQFLIQFYNGMFDGSFSKGELYEFDPVTMDARNSGTLASLCGLEKSLEENDMYQKDLSMKRILLINAFLFSSRGIPLIYSGDEIATLNNTAYKSDPAKKHDSRWLHRVPFDWDRAELRKDLSTIEGFLFSSMQKLISLRKLNDIFHSTIPESVIKTSNNHVYITRRMLQNADLLCLFNFSEDRQFVDTQAIRHHLRHTYLTDLIQGKVVDLSKPTLQLGPYEYLWLSNK